MENHPESLIAAPDQPVLIVHVDVLRVEKVARQSGETSPIRSEQAPGLAGEKLELALLDVHPIEPQTKSIAVAAHRGVRGHETQEITFHVSEDLRSVDQGVDTQTEARVLRAESRF